MKRTLSKTLAVLTLVMAGGHAAAEECLAIGGLALADAMDETSLVAAIGGDMTGASAIVTGQRETQSGLELDMQHHFISNRNGLLKTRDKAVLTKVVGREQTYMLEIEYNVVESRGVYAGFTGRFRSFGLFKMDEGKVVLRYHGEICR